MTNQYEIEDNVPDTTEVALANFEAQKSSLAAVDQSAVEAYNEIYNQLGSLYAEAEQRQDAPTMARLEAARLRAEMLKQTVQMNTANLSSVLEAAAHLGKKAQADEAELHELTEALNNYDTDHPLVSGLVEVIESEVYEYISESGDMYDDGAAAEAISEAWDEIQEQIHSLFPQIPYVVIYSFVAALDGEYELNGIQKGLFLSLFETFKVDEKAAS